MNKVYTWDTEKQNNISLGLLIYWHSKKNTLQTDFSVVFFKAEKQTIWFWFDFMLLFKMGEEEFQTSRLAL